MTEREANAITEGAIRIKKKFILSPHAMKAGEAREWDVRECNSDVRLYVNDTCRVRNYRYTDALTAVQDKNADLLLIVCSNVSC